MRKSEIGISTDTEDRDAAGADLQFTLGDFGYCGSNLWHQAAISLHEFAAARRGLDLRLIRWFVVRAERYTFTRKNWRRSSRMSTLDVIDWSK